MDPSQRARSTLATLLTKPPILGRTPSGAVLYDLAPQKQQLQEDKLLKQQQKMQRHTDNWFPGRLASTDSNDINYEILQWKEREIISSSPLENLDSVVINLFVPTSTEAFEAEFYSNSTETFVRQAIVGAVGCECGLRVRGTKRGVAFSNNLRGDYDVVFINSNDSMIKDLQAVLRHLREDVADIAGSTQPNSVEKDRNRDGNGVFAGTQADAFLLTNLSFGDSDAATPTLQSPASLVTTAPVVQYPRFSLGEMLPGTGYSSSVAFLTSRSSSFMTDAIDENSDRNRHVSVGGNKDAEYGSGYGDGRSDGLDPVEESVLMHDQLFQLERKAEELKKAIAWSSIRHRDEAASAKGSYLMSYSDVEKIRAVFNIFDSNSLGVITSKEIKDLHLKLGEAVTDEEAAQYAHELDPTDTGITFDKFVYWWSENHRDGKQNKLYSKKFKFLNAKLTESKFDLDRVIIKHVGTPQTEAYRVHHYYKSAGGALKRISPWHDVPLYNIGSEENGQILNFVCEIPKYTRAKFEIATGELYNPIKQDMENGELRYYKYGDMMMNYGAFPQTWEDPKHFSEDTQMKGDNDPLDVVDIGMRKLAVGEVCQVKVLGILAMIDDGETDWKVIVININDVMCAQLNDIDDVHQHLPGAIDWVREYFRNYKSYKNKFNSFALREECMPRNYALQVVQETHGFWKKLKQQAGISVVTKQ